MFRRFFLIMILMAILFSGASAQKKESYLVPFVIENGDTLYMFDMPESAVVAKMTRKQRREWKQYTRMVYNLKKVYPYSQIAKRKLEEMNDHFLSLSNKKERKDYVKQVEKEMFAEFEGPLKKLSYSQGKMLIKLIDRETGQSAFEVVKEMKGGFTAFFWQNVARIFGSNLKARYDPNGEDKVLEELIRMCEDGTFDRLYYSMFVK